MHIDDDGTIYDASLNQTNSTNNNNKFYRIQVSGFQLVLPQDADKGIAARVSERELPDLDSMGSSWGTWPKRFAWRW